MTSAFRSEWIKLRRPNVLLGTLGAGAGFAVVTTAITFAFSADDPPEAPGPAPGGSTVAELSAAAGIVQGLGEAIQFLGLVALVLVAWSITTEYARGTLRTLLVAEPRRLKLLAGKLAALLSLLAAAAVAATIACVLTAYASAGTAGVDTSAWTAAEALKGLAEVAAAMAGFGLLGAALAIALRSSVAAIGIGVAWLLPVESILAGAVDGADAWLPGQTLQALAAGGTETVALGTAIVVGGAYVLAATLLAGGLLHTRDVNA